MQNGGKKINPYNNAQDIPASAASFSLMLVDFKLWTKLSTSMCIQNPLNHYCKVAALLHTYSYLKISFFPLFVYLSDCYT